MVLRETTPIRGEAGSERLVVLMHGWCDHLFSLRDVKETVRAELRDADLMAPQFPSGLFSNTDLDEVCKDLADAIEVVVENRRLEGGRYQEIILIGFSLGSLIVRMTYLIGQGDMRESFRTQLTRKYGWVELVTRIILLAGNNRGWSMDPKPERMDLGFYLKFKLLFWMRVFGVEKLIASYQRGQPFVENLRIQWLRRDSVKGIPPTIQLYGDREDLVAREDMLDQQYCKNFILIDVPQTGHMDAANFHEPQVGVLRRERFVLALLAPIEKLRVQSKYATRSDREPEEVGDRSGPVKHVVFVIHGIRDYGDWTHNVRACIANIGREHNLHVAAITPAYQRFSMFDFFLGWKRRRKVEWFVNEYTQALALYPTAEFHFIGHSNGTYLLANALERYEMMRFDRVVFAGSVVRRDYPWNQLVHSSRVKSVNNYLAVDDWIVAIFPRFFEQLREATGRSFGDLGGAGVFGFQDTEGRKHQVLIRGGHGAAIIPANHASLVRYVLGIDESPKPHESMVMAAQVSPRTKTLAALAWVVWLALFPFPLLLSCFLTYLFTDWLTSLPFPWAPVLLPLLPILIFYWWLLKTL